MAARFDNPLGAADEPPEARRRVTREDVETAKAAIPLESREMREAFDRMDEYYRQELDELHEQVSGRSSASIHQLVAQLSESPTNWHQVAVCECSPRAPAAKHSLPRALRSFLLLNLDRCRRQTRSPRTARRTTTCGDGRLPSSRRVS